MENKLSKKLKFIERAKFVHAGKYDYTNVIYKNSSKKVEIGCPKHGIFLQAPTPHLEGHGCPFCKYNRMTREEFMIHVVNLYGDKYDYSKCTYTHKNGQRDNITVTCKIHGDFNKSVYQILNGQGCEKCSMEEWKMVKLIENPSASTISAEEPIDCDIPMKFHVKMEFKPKNSQISTYVWSEPFKSRTEAEELLGNLKMYVDMTNSVTIEAIIVEMKKPLLDSKTTLSIIKYLNMGSYEAYTKWWDETHPPFIPRNLHEYYSNFNLMFNGNEVEIESSVKKTVILPDYTGRRSA